MRQTTKRFLSVAFSFFLLVGSLVLFFQFIQPMYADLQKLKSGVQVREKFVLEQQETVKRVQELIGAYASQKDIRDLLQETLPFESDVSGAFIQFAGIVENSAISVQNFSISEHSSKTTPTSKSKSNDGGVQNLIRPIALFTLSGNFTGSYDNLKTLFEKIETNVRIFDVKSFSVAPAQKSNQDLYSVDLTAQTYYQK